MPPTPCPVCGANPCYRICPTQDPYDGDQRAEDEDYDFSMRGRSVFAEQMAESNVLSGHKRDCAYAAGGDCTCGAWSDEAYEDYGPSFSEAMAAERGEIPSAPPPLPVPLDDDIPF